MLINTKISLVIYEIWKVLGVKLRLAFSIELYTDQKNKNIYVTKSVSLFKYLIKTRFLKSTLFVITLQTIFMGLNQLECRFSSRPWLGKPSLWRSNPQTPLMLSSKSFRTKKEFPQTSNASFLMVSSLIMTGPCMTTTYKRSPPFICCSD